MTSKEFQKIFGRASGKGRKKPTANQTTEDVLRFLGYSGYVVWRNNTTGIFDPSQTVAKLLRFVNGLKGKPTGEEIAKCFVFRKNQGRNGIPDVIGYEKKTGRFISVEVKAGKDKLSAEQDFFIKQAKRNGCEAYVVRSFDDLLEQLKAK
jgi:hypothetical protein